MKHALERSVAAPLLKPAVARLVGRVSFAREILPSRTAAKDPQNAVQDVARILPRTPSPVLASSRLPNQRCHERPLLFGQAHAGLPHAGGIVLEEGGRLSAGQQKIANSIGAY